MFHYLHTKAYGLYWTLMKKRQQSNVLISFLLKLTMLCSMWNFSISNKLFNLLIAHLKNPTQFKKIAWIIFIQWSKNEKKPRWICLIFFVWKLIWNQIGLAQVPQMPHKLIQTPHSNEMKSVKIVMVFLK